MAVYRLEHPVIPDDTPTAGQWGVRQYMIALATVAALTIPFLVVGLLLGRSALGTIPIALAVLGVTLVKPEAGLLSLLLMMPMEDVLVAVPQTLTIIRLLGVYVLGVFILHSLMGRRVVLMESFIIRHFLLVLVMFVSILFSSQPLEGMSSMQTQVALLMFTVLALSLAPDWRMVDLAILFFFVGAVMGSICGLMMEHFAGQSLSAESLSTVSDRLALGEMSNPNNYGRAISIGMLAMPYLLWRFRGLGTRALILIGVLLIAVVVVKTGARGVWVSLMPAVPVAFWFGEARLGSRSAKTIAILVVALIVSAVAVQIGLIGRGAIERFTTIRELGVHAGGRTAIWSVCMAAFLDHPILGMGHKFFGYESINVALHHGLWLPGNVSRDPHSNYFAVLADLGIAGMIAYGAVLVYVGRGLMRLPRGPLRGTLVGMFLFLLLAGITNTNTSRKSYWMPMAVMAAAISVHRRTQAEEPLAELEAHDVLAT